MKYRRKLKKIEKSYRFNNFKNIEVLKEQFIYSFNKYKMFLIKNTDVKLVSKKLNKFKKGGFYEREIRKEK